MNPRDGAAADLHAFGELQAELGRNAQREVRSDVFEQLEPRDDQGDAFDEARNEELDAIPVETKRKKPVSMIQKCNEELRRRGCPYGVVEKFVRFPPPGHRVDLFGVIDIVALVPGAILGIQASTGKGHAAHRTKILASSKAREWVARNGRLELWSWALQGARGQRKRWTLRIEAFTRESAWQLDSEVIPQPVE